MFENFRFHFEKKQFIRVISKNTTYERQRHDALPPGANARKNFDERVTGSGQRQTSLTVTQLLVVLERVSEMLPRVSLRWI